MEPFRVSATLILLLTSVLCSGWVGAQPSGKKSAVLSSSFAAELSRIGEAEIVQNPDFCTSKTRPLRVNQELSSMLSHALQQSERIRIGSECSRIAGEEGQLRFCRFFFSSPVKTVNWTTGLIFLADSRTGEINAQSVECFGTP